MIKKYDLAERTVKFAEAVIEFAYKVDKNPVTLPLISQLVRSATSIGANYCEANEAITRKEFVHRIGICRKESKETEFWMRMIKKASDRDVDAFSKEARELNLIFSAIIRKCAQTGK